MVPSRPGSPLIDEIPGQTACVMLCDAGPRISASRTLRLMINPRILVVDDDLVIQQLLKVNLELEGYAVEVAEDGEEALAQFDAFHPNLVLLDIMMPRLDGWEVCRRLKAGVDSCDVPIVLLSARAQEADVQRGTDLGGGSATSAGVGARSARRLSARSQLRRMAALHTWITRQYAPNLRCDSGSVVSTLVSVITLVPPGICSSLKPSASLAKPGSSKATKPAWSVIVALAPPEGIQGCPTAPTTSSDPGLLASTMKPARSAHSSRRVPGSGTRRRRRRPVRRPDLVRARRAGRARTPISARNSGSSRRVSSLSARNTSACGAPMRTAWTSRAS